MNGELWLPYWFHRTMEVAVVVATFLVALLLFVLVVDWAVSRSLERLWVLREKLTRKREH